MTKLTRPVSPAELAEHFRQLAATFNIPVTYVPEEQDFSNEGLSAAMIDPKHKVIHAQMLFVRAVTDECRYAIALHELGHAVEPLGILSDDHMEKEELAWRWARHYALVWTVAMDQVEKIGLDSHRLKAARELTAKINAQERDKHRSKELRSFVKKLKL